MHLLISGETAECDGAHRLGIRRRLSDCTSSGCGTVSSTEADVRSEWKDRLRYR